MSRSIRKDGICRADPSSHLTLSDSEDASFSDDPTAKSGESPSASSHYLVPKLSVKVTDGLTIITPVCWPTFCLKRKAYSSEAARLFDRPRRNFRDKPKPM